MLSHIAEIVMPFSLQTFATISASPTAATIIIGSPFFEVVLYNHILVVFQQKN